LFNPCDIEGGQYLEKVMVVWSYASAYLTLMFNASTEAGTSISFSVEVV
jgi:hypothetical protein